MQMMTPRHRLPSRTLDDLYAKYKKSNPDMSKKEFKRASRALFRGIVEEVFKGRVVKLPYGMGRMLLQPYELKGKKIDFGMSNKIGKIVYHTNLHSDGKVYRLIWIKSSALFKHKQMYKFKLNRTHSRNLAALIKKAEIKIFKRYGEY